MRAITLDAATILGVADRVGSLEPGKIANLFIANGDPMEMKTQFTHIFINGRSVGLKSKHTELYERFSSRPAGGDSDEAQGTSRSEGDRLLAVAVSLVPLACRRQQEAPYTYAITGARIVPVSSAPIDNGTVVFSDGVITAVGANVTVPAGRDHDRRQGPDRLSRADRHGQQRRPRGAGDSARRESADHRRHRARQARHAAARRTCAPPIT